MSRYLCTQYPSRDGRGQVFMHHWRNDQGKELPPQGFVWIFHGLGEHAARYHDLAVYLSKAGFDVLAPDLPGHGLSRQRGGLKRLETIEELRAECWHLQMHFLRHGPLAARKPDLKPFILLGHSMGALLALSHYLTAEPEAPEGAKLWTGLVVSGPPLRLKLPVPAWKTMLAKRLAQFCPHLPIDNGISAEMLSYDAGNVYAYKQDPLVHSHASPALFLSMNAEAELISEGVLNINCPLMMLLGEDDPICDPRASRAFFDRLNTHKKLLLCPKFKHEVLFEWDRAKVWGPLKDFCMESVHSANE